MSKSTFWGAALTLALLAGSSVQASLIGGAGQASTSNKGTVSTTTTGQRQILAGIDPFGTYSFQLDYSYEPTKAQFVGIQGVNGYVVDSFNIDTVTGLISDIRGHYVGNVITTFDDGPVANGANPYLPIPPQQEIDIFEILFNDLAPALEKRFLVFAGDNNDFIQGMDANGNFIAPAVGPSNITAALLIIPGNAPNGVYPGQPFPGGPGDPNLIPLPAALPIGLVMGLGVLMKKTRRRAA